MNLTSVFFDVDQKPPRPPLRVLRHGLLTCLIMTRSLHDRGKSPIPLRYVPGQLIDLLIDLKIRQLKYAA